MHREVYALLYSDKKDAPPLLPSDTTQGYRTVKAKLGCKKVRPWKWMPFTNPARKDGAIFYHWRRASEEGKDYPFARFNKAVQIPTYSEQEYQLYLHDDGWTKTETDHLFDLCRRFDLRFIVIHDRYDHQQFKVSEEEYLIQELRKIESRKKEREKKAQDLQKLITAADTTTELRRAERKATKKKLPQKKETEKPAVPETAGIRFPDFKSAGVTLRSQRMKLPSSVGQKKIKALDQMLSELGVDLNPMPTEDIVQMFNELRSDLVLLYELKQAFSNCEYELQMLRHRFEALSKTGNATATTVPADSASGDGQTPVSTEEIKLEVKDAIIDVVGAPLTPNSRKRRESASSSSSVKKMKKP
ncbi:DNA methyltransferase 1-associated protein 1 isoform X4 [Ranitomeya imitator]|uniref:DNA methyltransferase 1-associated protein 1 isoform X4 n=1 Tax=Ranitomeya imitator TaxID=111125 RepID=UPI0037E8AB26